MAIRDELTPAQVQLLLSLYQAGRRAPTPAENADAKKLEIVLLVERSGDGTIMKLTGDGSQLAEVLAKEEGMEN